MILCFGFDPLPKKKGRLYIRRLSGAGYVRGHSIKIKNLDSKNLYFNKYHNDPWALSIGKGLSGTAKGLFGGPAPRTAFDLGMIPLGAGQSFTITEALGLNLPKDSDNDSSS